ncbi:MAG: FAD-dependent oxidoreductase, partial [Pseudomonadota bacterium]
MTSKPKIGVIGAGIGGLAAAAMLSRRADVIVFERASGPGGKIRQQAAGNHMIDCGPTVFTMLWVFEEIFRAAGADVREELTLNPLDTLARHVWRDRSGLDLYASVDQSADAIAAFSSREDADNYRKFCAEAQRVYQALETSLLTRPRANMLHLARAAGPAGLFTLKPFTTLWQHLSRRFQDPRLVQLFGRYATYCGCSPFEAPATMMLIAHVEQSGVWTLEGGMGALARALETVARRNGAEFVYDTAVERIEYAQDRVAAIHAGGRHWPVSAIVSNVDVSAVHAGDFGQEIKRAVPPPKSGGPRSQSAITWTGLAETSGAPLAVHTVAFSDDYRAEFRAVFDQQKVPTLPTTYIFAPLAEQFDADTSDAQPVFILINAPANGDQHTLSEQEIARCQDRMLAHLETCGITLRPVAETLTATTPDIFAARFPQTGGALFGRAGHSPLAPFRRPNNAPPVWGKRAANMSGVVAVSVSATGRRV